MLNTVLISAETQTQRFCIFIDDLDEFAGDREELLSVILGFQYYPNVKCCVSGRPSTTLSPALLGCRQLNIEQLNRAHIERFVKDQLRSYGLPEIQIQRFASYILAKARGAFIAAKLVTRMIGRWAGRAASLGQDASQLGVPLLPESWNDITSREYEGLLAAMGILFGRDPDG
jgi:hypothetical protein